MLTLRPEHIASILEIWSLIQDHAVLLLRRNETKVVTNPMPVVCSYYRGCRCDWIFPGSLSNAVTIIM